MTNRRNFYRLLHVQPEAPVEVIRSSFRALMKECRQHPDLGGSDTDAALLIEAYETLIDPIRRAGYDRELRNSDVKISRSPSVATEKNTLMTQRTYGRMKKTGAIVYRANSKKNSGQMVDLSPAGMRFLCGEELSVGSVIQISSPLLAATASVSQCRKTRNGESYAVGVKFIAVNFESPSGVFISTTV